MRFKTIICVLALLLTGCGSVNETSILIVGDTSFGESYGSNYYDHSLQNFVEILNDSDLVIANLETPLTDLENSPLEGQKDYIHWSDPQKAVQTYKNHNMHVFSLANNHSMDFGTAGLEQTLNTELHFFGAGFNEEEAKKPFIYNDIVVVGAFEYRKYYDKYFDFYADKNKGGINVLDVKHVQELRQIYPDKLLIVFTHWGANYELKSDEQTELAYQLIDAGADLIIGHGAHVMQEIEQYKDKWIIYGIGNFVFNTPGLYKSKDVPAYSLITRLEGDSIRLYPIFTDNEITNYQSRFVTEDEFNEIAQNLDGIISGRDKYGWYLQI